MNSTLHLTHKAVSFEEVVTYFEELKPEIIRLKKAHDDRGYSSVYASINLAFDAELAAALKGIIKQKKKLQPSILVVIGIGGSNLGTAALQEALLGKLYNERNPALRIYYADTVDASYIAEIVMHVNQALKDSKKVILNVVTKSGTTTETIANFEIFLQLLQNYHPHDFAEYVVATTDRDSVLWLIAQQQNYTVLEIPKNVGGRFSVFSAVGLFPLGLLGCDIDLLLKGAGDILKNCLSMNLEENYAAQTACSMYLQYLQGIHIQDIFLFSLRLEGIGKWYRQLMGESVGKEYSTNGKKVEIGPTPTVSLGTIDLHSVGQLYLGGPRDKATTFISIAHQNNDIQVPEMPLFEQAVEKIQGKSLALLMKVILQGVQEAYKKHKRPFVALELPLCDEYYLGQLLQYKMVEMMYFGFLLKVNPFDQPNVEFYKKETRRILASS